MYTFQRFNFFTYIHEEDSAQAMEKGITADYTGSHALFVNAAYNSLGYDSPTLARLFFPKSAVKNGVFSGAESLVSIENARKLIGFDPEHILSESRMTRIHGFHGFAGAPHNPRHLRNQLNPRFGQCIRGGRHRAAARAQ